MKSPRILECTLRDGSYVINFQFTKEDTANIVQALEAVGFDMIEVGHGMGLGASERGKQVAAETDEAYLRATAEVIKKADWGMFCIPGIASLDHLNMAADYGMKFIRIGTNVEDYQATQSFIEHAKKCGLTPYANLMKSYAASPKDFAKKAIEVEKYGAEVIYIVDSAGGMFPEDLEAYVVEIRKLSSTMRLAFHGHHNLGMGVANALKAVELGIEIVDTTLQGLGRSAGNTPTEQFLCALLRKGIEVNSDPVAVMDIAEKYIQPLIQAKGLGSIDLVAGLSFFHSSYMPLIEQYAKQYRVDPRRLIIAVSQYDKNNVSHAVVKEQAKYLAERGVHGNWKPLYAHYYGDEQSAFNAEEGGCP